MSNFEEFLHSINYAPVDVLKYFGLIKELSSMEKYHEEQLFKYQTQIGTMMTLEPSKEKSKLLSDLKCSAEKAHAQLLALHRERIYCVEILQNLFRKHAAQLDQEGEKFLEELKVMPKEQEIDILGRKSTREIVKQEPQFSRTGQMGKKSKKQPEVEPIPEDPMTKLYCYCQKLSSGTMVACDNSKCDREWFHLECVGLIEIPSEKQKWYCRDCDQLFK